MKCKKIGVLGLVLFTTFSTLAENYIQLDYSTITVKSSYPSTGNLQTKPDIIGVYIGRELSEHLAVEGLFASGVNKSDTTKDGATQTTPVSTKVDSYYGLFVKPKVSIAKSTELFSRFGYLHGGSTASTSASSASSTSNNWVYGIGVSYDLSDKAYISGAFQQAPSRNNIKSDSWSLGVGYRF